VENASKFDANVTSSNNSNPPGLVLQIEESIAINAQLCAGDLGDDGATT
jgi:hypothetical protein